LSGLKDPKDPAFKRYFYLLENLAFVKSFNMCIELVESDEHSEKVKTFMQEILVPLLSESDSISNELLDIILINIVEPNKTQRKNAYALAKEIIIKTTDSINMYVQSFLTDALIQERPDVLYQSSKKIYDLIYELSHISPTLLSSVLPQLECKIKSSNEGERLKAVALLARMFSEKDSELSEQHSVLLNHFLGRFLDIAAAIRVKCVQSTMHFLINHPSLRSEIVSVLNGRQHDADETVRFEVVNSIVETAKRDHSIVADSAELLAILKERSQDKKFKIRRGALSGLAMIYNKRLTDLHSKDKPKPSLVDASNWIQIKILNGYYHVGLEDQLLIERLLIMNLVPYTFSPKDKMKALFKLFITIDDHAVKAFIELQKNQLKMRKTVNEWVQLHKVRDSPEIQKDITRKLPQILKMFPDPLKSQEFLLKFSKHLRRDNLILRDLEIILKRDVDNKICTEAMTSILKKLGTPIMTNTYYNTVKILLSRIASVTIDKEGIQLLIELINREIKLILAENEGKKQKEVVDNYILENLKFSHEETSMKGLNLLTVLIYLFPAHFLNDKILRSMLEMVNIELDFVPTNIFKAFTHLGRFGPLIESHPDIVELLAPLCKHYATCGTAKQAKHAIRCLFVNTNLPAEKSENKVPENVKKTVDNIFQEILDTTNQNLTPSSEHYRTAIVAFGHIAYNLPERFNITLKNIISRKIVKELLIGDSSNDCGSDTIEGDWCSEDELTEVVRCRVEGLKAIARWLVGMKDNVIAAQKTFRMLCAFISKTGDILDKGQLCEAEKAWLRLSAGNAMLKICEQKGVGDEFNAEQFLILSKLMVRLNLIVK
jgi:sister chromatid cohesion protein PDS5